MPSKIKQIIQNSFYQLIAIYTILVLLISLNLFWKYSFQLQIFAFVLAILGILIIPKSQKTSKEESLITKNQKEKSKYLHYILFALAIIFIILLRTIPYFNNSIPLGYDAGIYKYAIESGLNNLDGWILSHSEPLFLYLMEPLKLLFSSQFILTGILIGFCILLGLSIYLVAKEYFNKQTGLIAILIYSVSLIQFMTFSYMYYRNIIGLSFALFSIYFLKKSEKNKNFIWIFIIFGGLLGAIHRPTFYIYGLSYFVYALISPLKDKKYDLKILKKNILYGIGILFIAGLFYLGKFKQAIFVVLPWVAEGFIQPGDSPGTFINFFTYQFSVLAYLPFALLGFFALAKKRKFNMIFLWTLITSIIVYFQFFFFNRFIIHLDIGLIILSAIGFSVIISNKKILGLFVLAVLLFSAGFIALDNAKTSNPPITQEELQTIEYLQNTEENAFVMATSSIYSPWLQGYSGRKTIAPGLFDYDKHNEFEWINFWTTSNINEINLFMNNYQKPLYVFIGQKQKDNLEQFSECFEIYKEQEKNKIYKYIC